MQPGDRIGPYVVERLLGVGNMGGVYLAVHPELGHRHAVKVLRRHLPQGSAVLEPQLAGVPGLCRSTILGAVVPSAEGLIGAR